MKLLPLSVSCSARSNLAELTKASAVLINNPDLSCLRR